MRLVFWTKLYPQTPFCSKGMRVFWMCSKSSWKFLLWWEIFIMKVSRLSNGFYIKSFHIKYWNLKWDIYIIFILQIQPWTYKFNIFNLKFSLFKPFNLQNQPFKLQIQLLDIIICYNIKTVIVEINEMHMYVKSNNVFYLLQWLIWQRS